MTGFLQRTFALSERGAKDMFKAVIACALTDLSLMIPIGVLVMVLRDIIIPLAEGSRIAPSMTRYIIIGVLALIMLFALEYHQYNATFLASYTESANQRISISEKLRKLPMSFFGERDLADLTTTIMSDTAMMEQAFSHFVPEFIGAVIALIPVVIGLFVIDARMAAALIWVIPAAFILCFATKKLQDISGSRNKEKKLICSDAIQECIENIKDIKAANRQKDYMKQVFAKIDDVERFTIKSEIVTGVSVTSAQMILKLGIATTVLMGVTLLSGNEISLMTLIIFLIAASRIFDPLMTSLTNLAAMFATLLQIKRMREIKEYPVQGGADRAEYDGYDIKFENVGFSYNTGERVLQNVSFTAKQGEVTALVGPSGGGKSTTAKLAARFWDVSEGRITLGGRDITTVVPEAYLKNFSIVFQDVVLFNNTIMENIRIGRRGATDSEVIEAAKAARCDEFISKLPKGYYTVVGENGSTLSGGERQRISIARALLKNAPVILLDEATASLDVENETLIQRAISNLIKNKTVLIIAHRMRTVADADKIIVLENGSVAEQGTPDELMKKGGIFKRMSEFQTESQKWKI